MTFPFKIDLKTLKKYCEKSRNFYKRVINIQPWNNTHRKLLFFSEAFLELITLHIFHTAFFVITIEIQGDGQIFKVL